MTPFLLLLWIQSISAIGEMSKETHKTAGASQQKNELSCYVCDSLEDHKCLDLMPKKDNIPPEQKQYNKQIIKKCKNDQRLCKVKRYSYTIGTENSTSTMKNWAIQRECTQKCEAGCIVIGERTKLYACTTCCSKTGCNDGAGANAAVANSLVVTAAAFLLVTKYLSIQDVGM